MSLDVYLSELVERDVFWFNITHNMGPMASAAGLYKAMWRPEELGITKAKELIPVLTDGLQWLRTHEEQAKALNPDNGWGSYEALRRFTESYLGACIEHPDANIRVSR